MVKFIHRRNGSAMIIAIIVATFIGVSAIASSQLILNEAKINIRYLDGLVARYSAEAGAEWGLAAIEKNSNIGKEKKEDSEPVKSGELTIKKTNLKDLQKSTYNVKIWNSGENNNELKIIDNDFKSINVNGAGAISFNLSDIEKIEGSDNCPDGKSLFVYLNIAENSGREIVLNKYSNESGIWNNNQDNSFYLSNIKSMLKIQPLLLTKFYSISSVTKDDLPSECKYQTIWKINLPQGSIDSGGSFINAIGNYGDIRKEIELKY